VVKRKGPPRANLFEAKKPKKKPTRGRKKRFRGERQSSSRQEEKKLYSRKGMARSLSKKQRREIVHICKSEKEGKDSCSGRRNCRKGGKKLLKRSPIMRVTHRTIPDTQRSP